MASNEEIAFRDEVGHRLAAKGGPRNCPICNRRDWVVGELLTQNSSHAPLQAGPFGAPTVPLISVWCQNCGNTMLINLFALDFSEEELSRLSFPWFG